MHGVYMFAINYNTRFSYNSRIKIMLNSNDLVMARADDGNVDEPNYNQASAFVIIE